MPIQAIRSPTSAAPALLTRYGLGDADHPSHIRAICHHVHKKYECPIRRCLVHIEWGCPRAPPPLERISEKDFKAELADSDRVERTSSSSPALSARRMYQNRDFDEGGGCGSILWQKKLWETRGEPRPQLLCRQAMWMSVQPLPLFEIMNPIDRTLHPDLYFSDSSQPLPCYATFLARSGKILPALSEG